MPSHNVFIVGIFLLSLQYVCDARICHPLNIEQCPARNQNEHGCYFYSKVSACLNDLITTGNCSDKDRMFAMNSLELNEARKNTCPDLDEGNCYNHQLNICITKLPFEALLGEQRDKLCHIVLKHGEDAMACLRDLKKVCSSEEADQRIGSFYADVRIRLADCRFLDRYDMKEHWHTHSPDSSNVHG